jgi:hypothetical protein
MGACGQVLCKYYVMLGTWTHADMGKWEGPRTNPQGYWGIMVSAHYNKGQPLPNYSSMIFNWTPRTKVARNSGNSVEVINLYSYVKYPNFKHWHLR